MLNIDKLIESINPKKNRVDVYFKSFEEYIAERN